MGNAMKKGEMVAASAALPGRSEPMRITNKHYVLGNPLRAPWGKEGIETAIFATGCFWGAEKGFWRLPGVHSTAVGYCAGFTPNPTYEEACSGQTGHTEGIHVAYDPAKISYVDLLRLFWQCHDPTQGMGQGNDRGTQYRSGIYPTTPEQQSLAESSKNAYEEALGRPITTEIKVNVDWYYAEDYHQQYLAKPGARPYCSAMPTGVKLPPFESWAPENIAKNVHKPTLPETFWDKHGPTPTCTIGVPNAPIEWPPNKM